MSSPIPEKFSRVNLSNPNAMVAYVPDLDLTTTYRLATSAVYVAQQWMPRVTGAAAKSLLPVYDYAYFGISWGKTYVRHIEEGTNPFTMTSLAGKTIPMWVNDPDGSKAAKIKPQDLHRLTRITEDGRRQVKIFRKAAPIGSRKTVQRGGRSVSVPRSYPGAPGRIRDRTEGGDIARGNVGVRWRHPGIRGRDYIRDALEYVADSLSVQISPEYAAVNRRTVG